MTTALSNIFSMANWSSVSALAKAFREGAFGEQAPLAEERFKAALKEHVFPDSRLPNLPSSDAIARWISANRPLARKAIEGIPGLDRFQEKAPPLGATSPANVRKMSPFKRALAEIRKMQINQGHVVDWKLLKKNAEGLDERDQIRLALELVKQLKSKKVHAQVKIKILEFLAERMTQMEKKVRLPLTLEVARATLNDEEETVQTEALRFLARTAHLVDPKDRFVIALSMETMLWDQRFSLRQETLNSLREVIPLLKEKDCRELANQIERSIKGQKETFFYYTHAAWALIHLTASLPKEQRPPRVLIIEAFLTHPNSSMRFAAILTLLHFLEHLEPKDRLPKILALEERLTDSEPRNREETAKGLIKAAALLKMEDQQVLIEKLKSKIANEATPPSVKEAAQKILDSMPPPLPSVLAGLV